MVGVLGDPVEIRVDGVAEHGERDEGLALKKRAAKFLLQRDNGIGQRGLGNATAFGRAGEITLLAERQKVADLVHLHVPPRGINRASRPRLPSAPVSKCEVVHTQRHTPCLIIANSISCNPPLAGGDRMKFDQIKRRKFIALLGGAAAWPLAARAEQSVVRLGYLAPARLPNLIEALRAGLRDFGYVEGQNLTIEYRFALGQTKSYDELAQELVSLDPAAIVLTGTPAALALKRQTTTIPIVVAPIADPIALGLARSLARPGGNVTGVTMYGTELAHKRMEIFKEAAAGIRRVAVLVNTDNPLQAFLWNDIGPIAPLLGLEFRLFTLSDFNELPTMFSTMARDGFDALTLFSDAQFFAARRRIAELAAMHRLPAMYESRDFVDDGGLISYGPNVPDLSRRAAAFVVKILNGAKASELPIEQPTKFELVINIKTAKALGIEVPPTLLVRADEVIE